MGYKCLRNSFLVQFTWHSYHCINIVQIIWLLIISISKLVYHISQSEKKMVTIILKTTRPFLTKKRIHRLDKQNKAC